VSVRAFFAVTVLLSTAVPFGTPLAGQGTFLDARMEVVLPAGPGPISVRLEYRVLEDDDILEFPFTLLTAVPPQIMGLRTLHDGKEELLTVGELRPHYWTGAISIPSRTGAGDTLSVGFLYSVEGGFGEKGRVTIPIPAARWTPRDPRPQTFLATVDVPPGWTITESFPTSVVHRPDGALGGSYQVALQSVPSMLILRMVEGESPFLTLERILDILVVSLLFIMALLGVRYLRGERA